MKREQAYNAFAIDDDRKQRLQTVASTHLQREYGNGIRKAAKTVGKRLNNVVITDKASLDKINRKARKTAASMQTRYNKMLLSAVENLPEPLSKEEYAERLQPFFDTIHEHNGNSLTPYLSDWASQSALRDFYGVNSIAASWDVQPPHTTTRGSDCEVALSLVPMKTEQALQFEFPSHNNCEHRLIPSNPKSVPQEPWTGRETESGKKHLIGTFTKGDSAPEGENLYEN